MVDARLPLPLEGITYNVPSNTGLLECRARPVPLFLFFGVIVIAILLQCIQGLLCYGITDVDDDFLILYDRCVCFVVAVDVARFDSLFIRCDQLTPIPPIYFLSHYHFHFQS